MGIRSVINENPRTTAGLLTGMVISLVAFNFLKFRGDASYAAIDGKAFFSDDDGKSWFIDDDSKLPPFDHNGRSAFRAALFRCGSGKPFVAYLMKYSDEQLKLIGARKPAISQGSGPVPQAGPPPSPEMAKKPNDRNWESALRPQGAGGTGAYAKVTTPTCPNGSSEDISPVFPSDSDATP